LRQFALTAISAAAFAVILLTATAAAPLRPASPAETLAPPAPSKTLPWQEPATATTGSRSERENNVCRRAWRCGPYDCGWRQICASASSRPSWQGHNYFWRRHQWRRHYW
jgi:hypothetical protein